MTPQATRTAYCVRLEKREAAAQGASMQFETLTLKSIRARPVLLKLKRPVVARIATIADWPLVLIDLHK